MFIVKGGYIIMKKLFVCFLMIMCLFMTGCSEDKTKVSISTDEFNNICTDNGFTVKDNSSIYEKYDYITDSKLASLDDIEIEMIQYTDSESAEKVLEGHIDSFNLLKSSGAAEKNTKGDNYHKYFLVSNNRYMISVRVDDTVIFCKTMLTNKDKVDNLLEKLGY